jgi:hypothetical protein
MDDFERSKLTFHIKHDSKQEKLIPKQPVITQNKLNKYVLLKVILSVGSAVATGVILGLVILSVIHNSDTQDISGSMETNKSVVSYDLNSPIIIPKTIFYGIQIGVFSKEENVARAQENLQLINEGDISFVRNKVDNQFHLYAGVAANLSDAEQLKKKYSNNTSEAIIKTIVLEDTRIEPTTVGEANLAKFYIQSREIAAMLLVSKDVEGIRASHQKWSSVTQKLRKTDKEIVPEPMVKLLNQAFLSRMELQKHYHSEHIQTIQKCILESILYEKKNQLNEF